MTADPFGELAARAEIVKLARVLGEPPERFSFLATVPAADIRALREQTADALFEANIGVLRRMAAASRLLPAGVLAAITEKAFGPLLSARMAGLVDPARGLDIARRLSPAFLADVAAELDPRKARAIISGIPAKLVSDVTRELRRRNDWITLGRFVDHAGESTAEAGLAVLDDAALLRVSFLLDDKTKAAALVALLPHRRYEGILRAAGEHDLWHAVFALTGVLGEPESAALTRAAGGLGEEPKREAVRRARELGVLDRLGPLGEALTQ
ncbi:hypothetical protein BAY61_04925 [Prauserella marina]|uniref:Uncharacterized protein n=1 Tax=Prauserella marina TaxID=530584 RepID=A0A222VKU2_9PSEU|nr:hypothetical protein [Prauserella marina]ASR34442.1 hypothetical protein BAY61_04925 [Prauserella marina]PWV71000.1 hypothetical protein DES30_11354 [Prauserella marina]SDD99828.1 hypothetical protein SAMN05421630_11613 [Prauserella marina]